MKMGGLFVRRSVARKEREREEKGQGRRGDLYIYLRG